MNDGADLTQLAGETESGGERHRHRRRRRHLRYAERRHLRDLLLKLAISAAVIAVVMVLWWWIVNSQSQ